MIELKNITKIFGNLEQPFSALHNINLSIKRGECISIMGTSGSGKTTLLNIIGTIEEASSGQYWIDGKDIQQYNQKEKAKLRNKKFGFIMQDFGLIPHYTVRKNILLPLQYTKIAKKEQEKRVDHLLERLYIQDKKNCYPSELSGGQKQRVAIARALVNDAEVILCDEPTGALDSKTTKEIMKIFMELHESGKTLIIVTHDEKVASYCEKIIYLEDGNIVNKK